MRNFMTVKNKLKFIKLDRIVSLGLKDQDNIKSHLRAFNVFYSITKFYHLRSKINFCTYHLIIKTAKLYVNVLLLLSASIKSKNFTSKITKKFLLHLNFKRNRYFPQLLDLSSRSTIFNVSLGIMSKYFSKKKNFLRSKSSY